MKAGSSAMLTASAFVNATAEYMFLNMGRDEFIFCLDGILVDEFHFPAALLGE